MLPPCGQARQQVAQKQESMAAKENTEETSGQAQQMLQRKVQDLEQCAQQSSHQLAAMQQQLTAAQTDLTAAQHALSEMHEKTGPVTDDKLTQVKAGEPCSKLQDLHSSLGAACSCAAAFWKPVNSKQGCPRGLPVS